MVGEAIRLGACHFFTLGPSALATFHVWESHVSQTSKQETKKVACDSASDAAGIDIELRRSM
jgi:hypothetical protein